MEPQVVIEGASFWRMVSAGMVSALPVFLAGFAAFVKMKTRFEEGSRRNDAAHDRIEKHQREQNGHIADAQREIAETRREIGTIQATCTERGRLETEIRKQINEELKALKE